MKTHYLSILGLDETATEEDIKSAYRRLSKEYHPDVNPSPDAEAQFIKIKEAYEYLTEGPEASEATFTYEEELDEREQWKRDYHQRAKAKEAERQQAQLELIQQLMKYLKPISLGVLVFNVLLGLDFLLPLRDTEQDVISVRQVTYSNRDGQGSYFTEDYYEVRFTDYVMEFQREKLNWKDPGATAIVQTTPIFSKPMYAVFNSGEDQIRLRQVYNVYYTFGFIIPVMLIMGGILLFLRDPKQQLNLSVVILMVLVIQLYFFYR